MTQAESKAMKRNATSLADLLALGLNKHMNTSQSQIFALPLLPMQQRRRASIMLATATAVGLFVMLLLQGAHAQTGTSTPAEPAVTAEVTTSSDTPATAPVLHATQSPRKYALQDVERVFNYLDSDHDGKISRTEAAAFKNIASHFDAADVNKDHLLTKEEFDNAINGFKPQ
jgi:hypothetical protein